MSESQILGVWQANVRKLSYQDAVEGYTRCVEKEQVLRNRIKLPIFFSV